MPINWMVKRNDGRFILEQKCAVFIWIHSVIHYFANTYTN